MDTKWKSNDRKSFWMAFGIVFLFTVVFMCFLPLFKERAENEFEDPFTGSQFIKMLCESNYIQHKYLRERADQQVYSFGDLYVDIEYVGTERDEYSIHDNDGVYTVPENVTAGSAALLEEARGFAESSVEEELWNYKYQAQELTQRLDYYAVDKVSGISVGNSNQEALTEIAGGNNPEKNPYIYYVYFNYDSVGNLENCGVSSSGDVGEFLKRVEALGRTGYLNDYYSGDSTRNIYFYNSELDEFYRYRFSGRRPRDMKIVYAMTQEQYQDFMGEFGSYGFLPNYTRSSELSYMHAGILGNLYVFALAAVILGAWMVYFGNRREAGAYTFQQLRICTLPIEVNAILVLLGSVAGEFLIAQMCAYQKGWFLPNVSRQFLEPMHLSWLKLPILAAMYFCFFFLAFSLGSVLPGMLHFKRYIREHSLLYRYWDRIVTYLKSFYQELVNFDIGTDARRIITKLVIVNFAILSFMSMLWVWGIFLIAVYSVIIYFLLKKYVKDIQNKYHNLLKATSSIARGDLDIVLSEDFGVFESYKNELRQIQRDFKRAVDEEVKSQRMRSELITNVSHDLKTPLTAIITYINLLKVPGISEEQREEYINTLDKKAVRLKVLIEDLFEVSKATTNNITLNYAQVDIKNLMQQCYLEYEDRIAEADLQFKFMLPEEKVVLTLDPQKTFRIFENLYTNIVKYALPSTRVYLILKNRADEVEIEIKNISRTELNVAPEELTERFVRGDGSRNTEGSGLGLAIARSFTELQHGSLGLTLDGDLFKVTLLFRKWSPSAEPEKGEEAPNTNPGSGMPFHMEPQRTPAPDTALQKEAPRPKHIYDPRRWRSERNLKKKKWY